MDDEEEPRQGCPCPIPRTVHIQKNFKNPEKVAAFTTTKIPLLPQSVLAAPSMNSSHFQEFHFKKMLSNTTSSCFKKGHVDALATTAANVVNIPKETQQYTNLMDLTVPISTSTSRIVPKQIDAAWKKAVQDAPCCEEVYPWESTGNASYDSPVWSTEPLRYTRVLNRPRQVLPRMPFF